MIMKLKTRCLFPVILILLAQCSSLAIKDRQTLKIASDEARSGNESAYLAMEKALSIDPPPQSPDIHVKILAELAVLPTTNSVEIIRKYMKDRIPARRGQSVLSFLKNTSIEKKQKEKELLETIESNFQQYSEILPEEIQSLGTIDDQRSLDLLVKNLNKDSQRDALIVQSLGGIFTRSNAAGQTGVASSTENQLVQVASTAEDANIRNLAIQSLKIGYGTEGAARIQEITLNKGSAPPLRMAALTVMGQDMRRAPDAEYGKKLKKAWYGFRSEKDYAEKIVEVLASIENKSIDEMRKILLRGVVKPAPPLRMEYVRQGTPQGLYSLGRKYDISEGVFAKIDSRIQKIMKDESLPQKPEKRTVSAALNSLAPDSDYFQRKKIALGGISERGVLSSILRFIVNTRRSEAWQIMVLRNVCGVSEAEAMKLREFYLNESTTLNRL